MKIKKKIADAAQFYLQRIATHIYIWTFLYKFTVILNCNSKNEQIIWIIDFHKQSINVYLLFVVASACHDVHSGISLPRYYRVSVEGKIFYLLLLFSPALCCSNILQLVLFSLFLSHCPAQAQACHSSQI